MRWQEVYHAIALMKLIVNQQGYYEKDFFSLSMRIKPF